MVTNRDLDRTFSALADTRRRSILKRLAQGEAAAWVERYRRFWEEQLDHLARYVEGKQAWE